jgi:formate hydrogenlyase subunit 3/multisubunit Na+/H+ antiporter MnhD subunit
MSAVTVIGLVTFLVGGIFALRQYDLKALLALICPRPVSPSRTSEG